MEVDKNEKPSVEVEGGEEEEEEEEEGEGEEQQVDEAQLEMERNRPLDPGSVNVTELERSIASLFKHCASISLLDLTDFPLTLMSLWNLKLLKKLQILSIRSARRDMELIPNVRMIHKVCALPLITRLNLLVHDVEEANALSNVVKLFEHSIHVLSITGVDYGMGVHDIVSRVLFNGVHTAVLPTLGHANIDFLEFDVIGLRKLIISAPNLKSIVVDCRGIDGFLPLFYAIDLMRIGIRERFDAMPMLKYEARHEGGFNNRVDHYSDGKMIWDARLSRIYLRFKTVETPRGLGRVLDAAELFFATADGEFEPINKDVKFGEVLDVFRARVGTFQCTKRLTIALEDGCDFVPTDDVDQVKVRLASFADHRIELIFFS